MINFPVLKRVKVSDFAMYVGTDAQPGLDHSFVPGVNVIVGNNPKFPVPRNAFLLE